MKALCVVASKNVVINGDVCFINYKKSPMKYALLCDGENGALTFAGKGLFVGCELNRHMPIKVMALWIWHMIVLRKKDVYLTGVLK